MHMRTYTGELPIEELLSMYGYVVPEEDSSTEEESPDEGQQTSSNTHCYFPFFFVQVMRQL